MNYEWMNEVMNEGMNEWMNEWMKKNLESAKAPKI
jgi:flagellar biosynthesis/type III secretory pathway protein FliH